MLVSPICTVTADYTECLLGEPDSEDGYYLTRPESLLGGQVVRKNFASLYTDPFRTVTDRKAIARTLAGVCLLYTSDAADEGLPVYSRALTKWNG